MGIGSALGVWGERRRLCWPILCHTSPQGGASHWVSQARADVNITTKVFGSDSIWDGNVFGVLNSWMRMSRMMMFRVMMSEMITSRMMMYEIMMYNKGYKG